MTKYIQLASGNCKACWKCVENCPQKVMGKIDIIVHRHSKISEPDKCIGCMKCASVCEYKAIKPADKTLHKVNH